MEHPTSTPSDQPNPPSGRCAIKSPWMRRLGAAAFLFFLIKGLAWLVVPAVLAWTAMR